jgi:hypothetical protein
MIMLYSLYSNGTAGTDSDIDVAWAFFYGENYVMARNVANDLISSCMDRKIVFHARIVLMSIERK